MIKSRVLNQVVDYLIRIKGTIDPLTLSGNFPFLMSFYIIWIPYMMCHDSILINYLIYIVFPPHVFKSQIGKLKFVAKLYVWGYAYLWRLSKWSSW